jgi:hypothetical protein
MVEPLHLDDTTQHKNWISWMSMKGQTLDKETAIHLSTKFSLLLKG